MNQANKPIYLSPPHMSGKELIYILEAFESNWIAPLGPHVDAFEKELASYLGVKDAAAVSSGTAALHLALRLLDIGKGDRVFCSSLTFVASANPILYLGAKPVFIDSEPETWNMSPNALARALEEAAREGKLPKAVIIVHLYGHTAKMDELMKLCDDYQVPVIEDAAESLGSAIDGKASGTFGKFGIFSFNGNKIMTTSGGGMLISNDVEAIAQARFLATQARDPALHYQHSQLGYNYRLSNVLAGIGRAQLEVLEDRIEARRKVFARYEEQLSGFHGLRLIPELPNTRYNRWLTVITLDDPVSGVMRDAVIKALAEDNIEARPVWKPLHLQPLFIDCPYYSHSETLSVSEQLFKTGICLPSGSNLTIDEQERIIQCITSQFEASPRRDDESLNPAVPSFDLAALALSDTKQ